MDRFVTVVLATSNESKLIELRRWLDDLPLELVAMSDVLPEPLGVIEDGATFEERAAQKARAVSSATGLIAIGDDSGLEVDALGGRPGVRSARFAHDRATDAENNAALLREMEELGDDARRARFRCALAVASPWSTEDAHVVEGRCEGSIARTPRGGGGFGYEPLFVVADDGRAMAELSEDEKKKVSARARAARVLRAVIIDILDAQLSAVEEASG